ncbi:MAG: hypothetical protein IJ726_01075, partial [Phocaeicola sp.]|nr:hypothetical protein [Phocaeicola sp.]
MFRVFPIIACIMICASSSLKAQNQRKDSSTLEHDTISASDTTKVRRSISRKDNVELNNDMKNYIDFNFFGNS